MPDPKEAVWSEDFAPTEREQILTKVRLGKLQPEEAEELARSKGLEPFAKRPDHRVHDPFKKPYWSLAMTLAWIVYRDTKKVMEWDNEFRRGWLEWRPQGSGHEIDPVKFADGKRFEEWGAFPDNLGKPPQKRQSDIDNAKAELWAKLRDGTLTASGLSMAQGKRISIGSESWIELVNHRTPDTGSREAFVLSSDRRKVLFWEVRLPSKKVLGFWPKPRPRLALSVSMLKKEIENWPGGEKPTKSELEVWRNEEGYSRARFREIYAKLPQKYRFDVGESRSRKLAGVK
jgi:hypothetical protein